jgi:hypothetical protein
MLRHLIRACLLVVLLTGTVGANDGLPPLCEKPPTIDEVYNLLPRFGVSVPGFSKVYRGNVQYVIERLVDRLGPPRDCPFVGRIQVHHCHWQCSVYYDAVVDLTYPFRLRLKKQCVESFMIRQRLLHVVGNAPPPAPGPLPPP